MRKSIRGTSILVVFALLLLLGIRWAEREEFFNLSLVRVDNANLVDSVMIAEVLRPRFGESLLKLNSDSLISDLMLLEGVDSAAVKIHLPETIVISLMTREPAVLLIRGTEIVPVTISGDPLPTNWGNDSLPTIDVMGEPDSELISSAIDLLVKRKLTDSVQILVSIRGITATENGLRILLDPEHVAESWLRWSAIRMMVSDSTNEVDLRYRNQAVLRSTEET